MINNVAMSLANAHMFVIYYIYRIIRKVNIWITVVRIMNVKMKVY